MQNIFGLWPLCHGESWAWRWHRCLACRDLGCIKCSGTWTTYIAGVMGPSVFFKASCSLWSEGLFGQSFSIAPSVQALRGLPCLGSFSVVQHIRHIEGPPWLGPYSVDQCIREVKGSLGGVLLCSSLCQVFGEPASLLLSCQYWRVEGREAMVMAPPPMHDSAVLPCFHGYPAFLHRHFPPQSLPLNLLDLSLHSQQQPSPWDCSTTPKIQLTATAPSRGSTSLSRVCMAVARTVWFSFHLGCHRSAVSLTALSVSPLTQTVAPIWGSDLRFSSSTHKGQVQSY